MTSIEKVLYTARTRTEGGREGVARSSDGRLDLRLSQPGGPGNGVNPEQLFAAGWSACFIGALGLAANQRGFKLPASTFIDAEVDLGAAADGFHLQARLSVGLPGVEPDVARDLIAAAHATCPYSRAVQGNIVVELTLA